VVEAGVGHVKGLINKESQRSRAIKNISRNIVFGCAPYRLPFSKKRTRPKQAKSLILLGGDDETRTRDLRRDRPSTTNYQGDSS